MFQRLSKMVVRSERALVVYGTIVVDQKALSPSACLYQQNLFGISPPISVAHARSIAKDGYKTILENLIKMFKDGRDSWVKQGEVFLLRLLNDMIAFPISLISVDIYGKCSYIYEKNSQC